MKFIILSFIIIWVQHVYAQRYFPVEANLRIQIKSYSIYYIEKDKSKTLMETASFLSKRRLHKKTSYNWEGAYESDEYFYKDTQILRSLGWVKYFEGQDVNQNTISRYTYDSITKVMTSVETRNTKGKLLNLIRFNKIQKGDTTINILTSMHLDEPQIDTQILKYNDKNLLIEEIYTNSVGTYRRYVYHYDSTNRLTGKYHFNRESKIKISAEYSFYPDSGRLTKLYRNYSDTDSLYNGYKFVQTGKDGKTVFMEEIDFYNTRDDDPLRTQQGTGRRLYFNEFGIYKIEDIEDGRVAETYIVVYRK